MRATRTVAVALAALLLTAGIAFATAGSGVTAQNLARGTLRPAEKFELMLGLLRLRGDIDVFDQTITIAPGGHTGWHTHPGAVLVVVKSGALTYTGVMPGHRCATQVFTAGQSFIDPGHGHVHIARNMGTTPVEFWATYTGVPAGGGFRIDADDPGC